MIKNINDTFAVLVPFRIHKIYGANDTVHYLCRMDKKSAYTHVKEDFYFINDSGSPIPPSVLSRAQEDIGRKEENND